jgi:hypothetical protein
MTSPCIRTRSEKVARYRSKQYRATKETSQVCVLPAHHQDVDAFTPPDRPETPAEADVQLLQFSTVVVADGATPFPVQATTHPT